MALDLKYISEQEFKKLYELSEESIRKARSEILITLDADGEHAPGDIPKLIKPIMEDKANLVLGRREIISRASERFLNWLTNFKVKVKDPGTGFRAMKGELALKLDLKGRCTSAPLHPCPLAPLHLRARIAEMPIKLRSTSKGKKIAWSHLWQIFYVLRWLTKSRVKSRESDSLT